MKIKARKLTENEIELAMQLMYADGEPQILLGEDVCEIGDLIRIKRVADEMTLEQLGKDGNSFTGRELCNCSFVQGTG